MPKRVTLFVFLPILGADEANRTPDLLITNQLLYQLSYISEVPYSSKVSLRNTSPLCIYSVNTR